MDGIVNILKPSGMSSHDVINLMRKIFQTKKIGHTGTLDPEAAGVLPICIGKATKLSDRIAGANKKYRVIAKLGIETDSFDTQGNIIKEYSVPFFSDDSIKEALQSFSGTQSQMPPIYSAIKVDGKKLYEYALKNEEVTIKPREITVYSIDFVDRVASDEIVFDVECSKGTYVRSICHDLGKLLGCGAAMKRLVRLSSGRFKIDEAYTIEELLELSLKSMLGEAVVSLPDFFKDIVKLQAKKEAHQFLENGNPLITKNFCENSLEIFKKMNQSEEFLICFGEDVFGLAEKKNYPTDGGFAGVLTYRF